MARYPTKVTTDIVALGRREHWTATKPAGAGEPQGWSIQCQDFLTEAYNTEAGAYSRLGVMERAGMCPLEHRVIPMWKTFLGRQGAPAKPQDEELQKVTVGRR
jgi:hypothetical protein